MMKRLNVGPNRFPVFKIARSKCLTLSGVRAGVALFLSCFYVLGMAQTGVAWPNKPVTLIVPNSAGGPSDLLARLVASKLSESIKVPVLVDNRPSNNGIIAVEYVAKNAPSNGTVLLVSNSGTQTVNPSLYQKLPYDAQRDFAPITEAIASGLVAVALPSFAPNSIRELVAFAKKNPHHLSFAIAGATGEIGVNLFEKQAHIEALNINYKGGTPAVFAVMSGDAHINLANLSTVSQLVEGGKLKIIGVTSAKRDPLLPNVPTFAENDLEGYELEIWYGFHAPAKTSSAMAMAYQKEIARILQLPEIKDKLSAGGYTIVASTPEAFEKRIQADLIKFRRIIIDSKMPLQ